MGVLKVWVMEIICELELWLCEVYCGFIGWWVLDGWLEFNVVIWMLMYDGKRVVMNVGGGIVWDLIVVFEYEEVLWKV